MTETNELSSELWLREMGISVCEDDGTGLSRFQAYRAFAVQPAHGYTHCLNVRIALYREGREDVLLTKK